MIKKVENNTADLLERMLHVSNDPENPTMTDEELRVRIIIIHFYLKKKRYFFLKNILMLKFCHFAE